VRICRASGSNVKTLLQFIQYGFPSCQRKPSVCDQMPGIMIDGSGLPSELVKFPQISYDRVGIDVHNGTISLLAWLA